MNHLDAEQIVVDSLKRRGASCIIDTKQNGVINIIATWKSTVWRILVKTIMFNEEKTPGPSNKEIKDLQDKALENNQIAVIARVYSDINVEYHRAVEDGRIIRPRCLIKARKTRIFRKEYQGKIKELV
jgi:hypothetical protein